MTKQTKYETIQVEPLSPVIGAEISGVDLSKPLGNQTHKEIHDALMEKNSGLSKAEREMIVVATSGANDCHYCVVAHGAIAAQDLDLFLVLDKPEQVVDAIFSHYEGRGFDPSAEEREVLLQL